MDVQVGGLTLEPLVVDHDSEGSRELVYKDGDYCLLQPLAMTEISSEDLLKLQENLKVIVSSLPSGEEVKLFQILITLRVKYWTLQPNCGVVSSFDTGLISEPAQLYTCLLDLDESGDKSNKVILCCLSKRKDGLELFIQELDAYAERLRDVLKPFSNSLSSISQDHVTTKFLQSWTKSILYLKNVVFKYHADLPVLLHTTLTNEVKITGSDENAIWELHQFIKACSVDIFMKDQTVLLLDIEDDSEVVTINVTESALEISSKDKSEFSEKWAEALTSKGLSETNSFYLKRVIETVKLKIIQHMNVLKRLLRDAETNYYALYKCYTFLKSTGNIELLLECSVNEAKSQQETETLAVLSALKEYHVHKTVGSAVQSNSTSNEASPSTNKPLIVI